MDCRPTREQEIAALRVRRTWTGKLVLQLRRRARKVCLPRPGETVARFEDAGLGPWRDANGNDAAEIADVVSALTPNKPLAEVWIAKTDFSKYFQRIRHADLKRVCRRKIACAQTLRVLDAIIDSTPGGVGIPVGNLTSQWLANLLGNEIDQWIKRDLRVKRYLRYMDDMVAIFASQPEAALFVQQVEARAAHYGLTYSKWSVHRATQGINALGYRIWPTHKLLRRRAIVAFRRDMRRLARGMDDGWADIDQVTARVRAFVAHAKHGDTWRLRKKLFALDGF
jgi:hypothetical protein